MKKTTYIIFIIISLVYTNRVHSQVTIGMSKIPNSAALLELVEYTDDSSGKGLLLPRVRLQGNTNAAPMSAHVPAMMVYNIDETSIGKDVYINNGQRWHPLGYLPTPTQEGDYLSIDSSGEPTWRPITVPPPTPGIYTLLNSTSYNLYEIREIENDNSPWFPFGDTIKIMPRHAANRLIVTVQVLVNKEYSSTYNTGWVNYTGGIFLNDQLQDYRDETLVYQSFNNKRTLSLVTLHFVVENLPAGLQNLRVRFKRNESQNFNSILYIGFDNREGDNSLNLFNSSSSISVQYYEDKSSALI